MENTLPPLTKLPTRLIVNQFSEGKWKIVERLIGEYWYTRVLMFTAMQVGHIYKNAIRDKARLMDRSNGLIELSNEIN